MIRGVIVAPASPTRNSPIYDVFIVSEGLLPAVPGVARVEDAGLNPHWRARLYLRGDARGHLEVAHSIKGRAKLATAFIRRRNSFAGASGMATFDAAQLQDARSKDSLDSGQPKRSLQVGTSRRCNRPS